MEFEINELNKNLEALCEKVNNRINELGDKDVMTYRSDPQIKDLQTTLCEIYRKGMNSCKTYGEAKKICETFRKYPECLTQLMLSEELACPTK
ncbi:hypothetical protein [[Eubacterium] cellulosolvens]